TPVITPVSGNFLAEGKVGGLDINHLTVADLEAGHPPLPTLLAGQAFQVSVVGTGHQFLIDIAHAANPFDDFGHPLIADADNVVNTFAGIPLSNNSFEADSLATGAVNVQPDAAKGNFAFINPAGWQIISGTADPAVGGIYAPTAAIISAAGHA